MLPTLNVARFKWDSFDLLAEPLGFKSGETNLYRYVGNNPINAIDPSGQKAQQPQGSVDDFSLFVLGRAQCECDPFSDSGSIPKFSLLVPPTNFEPSANFERDRKQFRFRRTLVTYQHSISLKTHQSEAIASKVETVLEIPKHLREAMGFEGDLLFLDRQGHFELLFDAVCLANGKKVQLPSKLYVVFDADKPLLTPVDDIWPSSTPSRHPLAPQVFEVVAADSFIRHKLFSAVNKVEFENIYNTMLVGSSFFTKVANYVTTANRSGARLGREGGLVLRANLNSVQAILTSEDAGALARNDVVTELRNAAKLERTAFERQVLLEYLFRFDIKP